MRLTKFSDKTSITLDTSNEIARGGEGIIYPLGTDKVVKIYHKGKQPITEHKYNELRKLQNKTGIRFIVPTDLLINGGVVGFIMDRCDFSVPFSALLTKNYCDKEHVSFQNRLDVAKMLIESVYYCHTQDIVIGDLNPYNIMVDKDTNHIAMLDTDSYQVKGTTHSGILLEDIRDFARGGNVDKDSDLFSLAVLIFNLLTFVHPYKGMHKTVKSIAERMRKNLSILSGDPQIIIPKCYSPVSGDLFTQFVGIFVNGGRFLLSMNSLPTMVTSVTNTVINSVCELLSTKINNNCSAISKGDKLHCKLEDSIVSYSYNGRGILTHSNITTLKDNTLIIGSYGASLCIVYEGKVCINDVTINIPIKPSSRTKLAFIHKYLLLIDKNLCVTIDIEFGSYKVDTVFSDSFRNISGLVQVVAGNSLFTYYEKGSLNTALLNKSVKDVRYSSTGKYGILEALEQGQIKYYWYSINNLKVSLVPLQIDVDQKLYYLEEFNDNLLVTAFDDKIVFLNKCDFSIVNTMSAPITSDAQLFVTSSGIVALCNNETLLLNKQ